MILVQCKLIDYCETKDLILKYCGRTIIILENTLENDALVKNYERLHAPMHLIAIPCKTTETELEITQHLTKHNVNYKRSNQDIEILFINAKEARKEGN